MRNQRTWTALLAVLALLSLSSGSAPLAGFVRAEPDAAASDAPWTPEVPAIELALGELGIGLAAVRARAAWRAPSPARPGARASRPSSCSP